MKPQILIFFTFCSSINAFSVFDEMNIDINEQTFILFTKPYPESLFSCWENPDGISNDTCTYKKFHGNLKNLPKLWPPIVRKEVKSWCSVSQGMWLFYSEPEFSARSSYSGYIKTPRSTGDFKDSVDCKNLPDGQQIQSIRHMSHANLSQSALSLFTGQDGVLQLELFLDGEALSLPEPVHFSAFGFSSFEPWTLYEDIGFRGTRTCLLVAKDALQTNNREIAVMSVGLNLSLRVGSIQKGCDGTEEFLAESLPSKGIFSSWKSDGQSQGSSTKDLFVQLMKNPSALPSSASSSFLNPGINLELSKRTGESILFHGEELVLPSTFKIQKATFIPVNDSGMDANDTPSSNETAFWQICSDLDFTGECRYVRSGDNETIFKTPVTVMSVKLGCSDEFGDCASRSSTLIPLQMLFLCIMQLVIVKY